MNDFYVFHIQYLVVLIWLKTVLLAIIFQEINKLRQSQQSAPILINNQIYSTINCYCSCILCFFMHKNSYYYWRIVRSTYFVFCTQYAIQWNKIKRISHTSFHKICFLCFYFVRKLRQKYLEQYWTHSGNIKPIH